ncbi:SH3 domain-containing protein [Enterocloster bolteae]|uniref:SH3 domain-containing protein n=1 Tax=Enterocloster bolteae TaxID=208479 RepID=UPI0028DB147F|nr:SH3 domain-containing protein [Enterocloster bolteae]
MREDDKRIPEELQKRRSRKKKERSRQVMIYRTIIAATVLLFAAGTCFAILSQRGRTESDREESQTELVTETAGSGENELIGATPSSAEEIAAMPSLPEEAELETETEMQTDETEAESAAPADRVEEALREYENPGIADVSDRLNIREEADDTASIIGRLPENGVCEILEQSDVWHHIRSGTVEGYVNGSYLLTGDEVRERVDQVLEAQDILETAVPAQEPDTQ